MKQFLKKLFNSKDRELTFVLFDDEDPGASTSYTFRPAGLWRLFYTSIALTVCLVLLLVMFTPLGSLVYTREDEEMRKSLIEISKRVENLQDSLRARDAQLTEIQQVLVSGEDTTFSLGTGSGTAPPGGGSYENNWEQPIYTGVNVNEMISQNEILFSGLFLNTPEFPSSFPVEGTLTRGYNPATGHYGIDIATKNNTPFRAIANGTVINQDWTMNFGFVLHVQHSGGIVSVYKHASSLSKSTGDIVLKGDILGTVGDTGILSSGPHLHMEIWKNGTPQNPSMYLLNP